MTLLHHTLALPSSLLPHSLRSAILLSSCLVMSAPSTSTTPPLGFSGLPLSVFTSLIAPHLPITDLISAASTSRAGRRLVLSPSVWRHRLFRATALPVLPSSTSLSSWCDVVQQLEIDSRGVECPEWPSPIPSLHLFPHLRSVRMADLDNSPGRQPYRFPSVTSLASLRHLTRISLWWVEQLDISDLKLLSTLPALASFTAVQMSCDGGTNETLREWLAVSAKKQGTECKADGVEQVKEEEKAPLIRLHQPGWREDPNDASLSRRFSPLLLFLHTLAAKPSFVHLRLQNCDLNPFVFDHLPVWPHLLCLSVEDSQELSDYSFAKAAQQFPSLTSFSSPSCTEQAIRHLVAIPKLEELCFGGFYEFGVGPEDVRESVNGFRVLSEVKSLRSVQYYHPDLYYDETCHDIEPRSYAALASVFTLKHLTRLTVPALLLDVEMGVQPLSQHCFPQLRCLELHVHDDDRVNDYIYVCPQTDAALLPLVKPADVVVPGRTERQAARAKKRPPIGELDHSTEEEVPPIPADSAANFPVLECLALPYQRYNKGESTGRVSAWMKRQLRRSYEYERADEWEQEMITLGRGELLKSLA